MTQPHLVYFGDAMCSWCHGFSPAIEALRARYGAALPIRLVNGGLRPGATHAMGAAQKAAIRPHWEQVTAASGQPFDFAFFDREGFVYDTEPAARAVVTVREMDEDIALPYFIRILRALCAENRDVTATPVLAALAGEFGVEEAAFLAAFDSEAMRTETAADFAISQRTGVTGFPTLIAGNGEEDGWTMITQGYQPPAAVLSTVARWLAAQG